MIASILLQRFLRMREISVRTIAEYRLVTLEMYLNRFLSCVFTVYDS
jgi:hypothetical protein